MKIFAVLGINHKVAKGELREMVALNSSSIKDGLRFAKRAFEEIVLLSTCNRTEVYVADSRDSLRERLTDYIKGFFKIDLSLLERFYFFSQEEALKHLFRVAGSLDSMVVGEVEILGQLKSAYRIACENKTTGKTMNSIFQHSFRVAKRIRTETDIAKGNYSIPSIACRIASEKLGDLRDKTTIVIGAGKISSVTLKHLVDKGVKTIFVGSRTFKRADELAKRFNGIALHLKDCFEKLSECDLLISQTSSPHYIIKDIPDKRKNPLVLIDLAIPRDIEPNIGRAPGVFLYNLDSFQGVIDKTLKTREYGRKKAEAIIKEEMQSIMNLGFRG
ncbi:MAG: glutamyl-tRNA reductase [bacterium]